MRSSVVLCPPVAHAYTNTTHAHTLSLLSQALQRKCQRHREMESQPLQLIHSVHLYQSLPIQTLHFVQQVSISLVWFGLCAFLLSIK